MDYFCLFRGLSMGGGGGVSRLFPTHSSVAGFLVWGGQPETPKCTDSNLHTLPIYNRFSSFLLHGIWRYKRQYTDKTLTLREIYEYASELRIFSHFHILKLLFPYIILFVLQILCHRNIIIFQVSNYICILIQSLQIPFITYGMAL